ncbi:hypothetical protein BLA29_012290 [Euroglyphus maynei]|uniref:Uncharacterized protein n=1 Tax=Euroglyphus maynei TaxID=6958 RepID=A0A1Y3BL25_EURMA|nr:hypothetical protein BLA29_012290 [Euroglyphus maynei]
MFTFNPDMAADNNMDEGEAAMDIVREQDENDDNDNVKEIDIDEITMIANESDDTGTKSAEMRRNFAHTDDDNDSDKQQQQRIANDQQNNDGDDDIINEPIDESLFAEDDAELLDDLENELNAVKLGD